MTCYLIGGVLQTANESELFGPAEEVPLFPLSGPVDESRHVHCIKDTTETHHRSCYMNRSEVIRQRMIKWD